MKPLSTPGSYIRRLRQISIELFLDSTKGAEISPIQFGAMEWIEQNPGTDQINLAKGIDADRTTIVRVVGRLVAMGLLVREVSTTDRRSNTLTLTTTGKAHLRKYRSSANASQARLMAPLSEPERIEFMTLIEKLVAAHANPEAQAIDDMTSVRLETPASHREHDGDPTISTLRKGTK